MTTYAKVIKTFEASGTPSPVVGTVGILLKKKSPKGLFRVEFWAFKDTDNIIWGPGRGDGSEPFVLHFKPDEIEVLPYKGI